MFFTTNDLIELEDANYLVSQVAIVDNQVYYEVNETDKEDDTLLDNIMIVKAVSEKGNLYIEEITDEELLTKIKENFDSSK